MFRVVENNHRSSVAYTRGESDVFISSAARAAITEKEGA